MVTRDEEIDYDPSCYQCRMDAGKAACGVPKDPREFCRGHLIRLALSALSREGEVVVEGYAPADMLVYPDDYSLTDLSDSLRPDYVAVTNRISRREVK